MVDRFVETNRGWPRLLQEL